jgi:hypothetical protein
MAFHGYAHTIVVSRDWSEITNNKDSLKFLPPAAYVAKYAMITIIGINPVESNGIIIVITKPRTLTIKVIQVANPPLQTQVVQVF